VQILGHINYGVFVILLMAGLYTVMARGNLIKKIIGLNIFQASVFLLYITMGKIYGGTAPIADADVNGGAAGDATGGVVYSNPLPHVLILTAIVVGVATSALGLALVVRIREAYGSIEEDEIERQEQAP
jgi:multicomponent Na+:H+ antiporter subunit C